MSTQHEGGYSASVEGWLTFGFNQSVQVRVAKSNDKTITLVHPLTIEEGEPASFLTTIDGVATLSRIVIGKRVLKVPAVYEYWRVL